MNNLSHTQHLTIAPLVAEVLKIFDATGSLNFRQIRNSLEHLPGLNEFSLSSRRPLSGHST
ncbi:hypothetical protein [Legionella pneumophila]|uniref:hypothetical protein n=1 Tax=Legionella pneumophila TaxID=446 RepID=UPI0005C432F6|nr:hypothetical protein [Legionella pneumophila]GAN30571.1 hypothetical protein lpymt_02181 [Legionella pneumophila]